MKTAAFGIALVLALTPETARAQESPDVVGDWLGTIKAGAVELRVALHVKRENNKLVATFDSIDQGANGLPIDSFDVEGNAVAFAMKRIGASYKGTIDAKGDKIEGTWSQGVDIPLVFERAKGKAGTPVLKRPQMPKAPFPYRVEEVRYAHTPGKGVAQSFSKDVSDVGEGSVVLAATLTVPKGKGPFPAAILISGSGPQDRDETLLGHKPFLVIADHLTRHGIAVLRFDDRGTAKSTGDFAKAVSDDFADDAEAGFHFLRSRDEIARDKIGLIGHSEGGLIAPIVAARNKDIAYIVLMAGPGVPGTEIIRLQAKLISKAEGEPDEKIKAVDETNAKIFEVVRTEKDVDKLRAKTREIIAAALDLADEKTLAEIGDRETFITARVASLTTPWMLRFLVYDPRPALAKVQCPVLAINGELDLQVDPDQNLPEIRNALEQAGNADFEVAELKGLNHLFQTAKTGAFSEYSKIEETFSPKALDVIVKFIAKRFL